MGAVGCDGARAIQATIFAVRVAIPRNRSPPMPFVSKCCEGERCICCGRPAEHKVNENIFFDDPYPARHELTAYLCHYHFRQIMGPAADRGRDEIKGVF